MDSGYLMLVAQGGLAAVAATALADRVEPRSTSGRALVALVTWVALVVVPVHVLGWLGVLYAGALAAAGAGLSLSVLAAALLVGGDGAARRERVGRLGRALGELAALPFRALRLALAERSVVVLGLLVVYGVLAWTSYLTWLAPSGSWDGLTYHEPIAYLSIQNHGFALVDVPAQTTAQQINTAPRLGHGLSTWLVIWTDRRLVELAPTLLSPLLLVATYSIARRFTGRVDAMGWACVYFLVPTIVLQLRSTMMDMPFAAVFIAAAALATRPHLRVRDAWMAGLAIALMGGFKATALVLTPLYALWVLGRVVARMRRGRRLAWGLSIVGGVVLIVGLVGPTYIRNLVEYENPVWPRDFHFESIGVHFEGPYDPYHERPTDRIVDDLLSPPEEGRQYHDSRDNGYGNGPPFVLFPLALVGLLLLFGRAALSAVRARPPLDAATASLLGVVVPSLITLALSPAYYWARYNVYAIGAGTVLVAWLLSGKKNHLLAQGVLGAMLVTAVMTLWWSEPGWGVSLEQAREMMDETPMERATQRRSGNFNMQAPWANLREREIAEGDVVAYADGTYLGILWNEQLSNRVEYVAWPGSGPEYLAALDAAGAEWVLTKQRAATERAIAASPRWERLGYAVHANRRLLLYRRRPD